VEYYATIDSTVLVMMWAVEYPNLVCEATVAEEKSYT
jgi:hypothetical protein